MKRIIGTIFFALLLLCTGLALVFSPAQATDGDGGGECVPKDAYTETTDWVTESPGPGWYEVDRKNVVDKEDSYEDYQGGAWVTDQPPPHEGWYEIDRRTTEVVVEEGYWQRYSYNGKWESNTEAPPFPSSKWQPNVKGDPHGVGKEGPYFRSHGNKGNGDWFYLDWNDAVTQTLTEYKFQRKFEGYSHAEYKFSFDHPAVTCPDEPVVCPEGTDKAGQEVPEGETIESFCDEDVVEECPDGDKNGDLPGCDPVVECPDGDLNGDLPGCDKPDEPEEPVDECKDRPVVGGPCAPVDEPKTPETPVDEPETPETPVKEDKKAPVEDTPAPAGLPNTGA